MDEQVDKQLIEFIATMSGVLGLGDWDIGLNVTDKPGGSDVWSAATSTDSEYLEAIIDLKPNLPFAADTRQLLIHELLHIALAELRATWLRGINSLDGASETKDLIVKSAEYAENRAVQRLSRGIAGMWAA